MQINLTKEQFVIHHAPCEIGVKASLTVFPVYLSDTMI